MQLPASDCIVSYFDEELNLRNDSNGFDVTFAAKLIIPNSLVFENEQSDLKCLREGLKRKARMIPQGEEDLQCKARPGGARPISQSTNLTF